MAMADGPEADRVAELCIAAFARLPTKGKPPLNAASWTVLAGIVQWDATDGVWASVVPSSPGRRRADAAGPRRRP